MEKRSACAIIVNKKGEFLLQKKTLDYEWFPGQWSLFGGGIEEGESPLETVKRELKEELGISFEKMNFFKKNKFKIGENSFEDEVFVALFEKKISDIKIGEGAGFAFFDEKELDSLDIFPEINKILKEYIQECH